MNINTTTPPLGTPPLKKKLVLYGPANDPRTANDPGPQMILDRK